MWFASLLCVALLGTAMPARAEALDLLPPPPQSPVDRPPPVGWAVGAGVVTALVPLSIGASLFASNFDTTRRQAASLVMAYGLALSPIVSHLVVREWDRAGIFGAIPFACAIGITVLSYVQPDVTYYGTREGRWAYGLILSFATLSAGVGIADTYAARTRFYDKKRAQKLSRLPVLPAPYLTAGGAGIGVGGVF
jgi:hypothetical protein